jgi:raffinose synthase
MIPIYVCSCVFPSLEKGGVSPRFVIIDDGWQSVAMDPVGIACLSDNSAK